MSAQSLDYRTLIQPELSFTLYNPASTPVEFTYGGDTYVIPANGTLPVGPAKHRITDIENLEYRHVTAKEILEYAVGDDGKSGRVGGFGVRVLFGDERDELVMADAAQANREKQYQDDLLAKYAHQKAVNLAKESGLPPVPPDKRVREAFERIARYESENAVNTAFACQVCNWPCFSQQQLSSHMESSHQGQSQPAGVAAPSGEVDVLKAALAAQAEQIAALTNLVAQVVTAPKNKGGRPRKPRPEASAE